MCQYFTVKHGGYIGMCQYFTLKHGGYIGMCQYFTVKHGGYIGMYFCNYHGWFWLENKITENQWKITETIYTHFQKVLFFNSSDHVIQLSEYVYQMKIAEIS
jgi:hypothetical protein